MEQPYLICPACGCSFHRNTCTSYLECEDRAVARSIATSLDELIKGRAIPELTPEEAETLQRAYKEVYQKFLERTNAKGEIEEENRKKEGYILFE
ncbi:MAG: hypothetical protein LBV40_04835 [Methanomicrobiales archaeon]|nr:hypothetical protein [Methanomicrobiales archaeon]